MTLIPTEAAESLCRGDIPEKNASVAAGGSEGCVVGGDAEGEDGVAVGGVGLD